MQQPMSTNDDVMRSKASQHTITEADIEEEQVCVPARLNAADSGEMHVYIFVAQEKIASYEAAFKEIKEATGVADVNEVIQKFITQEETHKNLQAMYALLSDRFRWRHLFVHFTSHPHHGRCLPTDPCFRTRESQAKIDTLSLQKMDVQVVAILLDMVVVSYCWACRSRLCPAKIRSVSNGSSTALALMSSQRVRRSLRTASTIGNDSSTNALLRW
mgnify:CR=1 FL=1|jgi:hypothetical protein